MSKFFVIDRTCYRRREESSMVRDFFLTNLWAEAAQMDEADVVVFFACSGLRFLADEKMKEIEETRVKLKPGAKLVVGGCLPGMEGDRLRKAIPEQTLTPTDFSALNQLSGITTPIQKMTPVWGPDAICPPLSKPHPGAALRMLADDMALQMLRLSIRWSHSAFLKQRALRLQRRNTVAFSIAAGCSRRCAYCAKPFASGPVRSKPIDAVLQSMGQGLRLGYRAFDFYADSIGTYGLDQNVSFGNLLEKILEIKKRFTIGLFDVHPQDFIRNFDLIHRLCQAGKLHYIYVAVQSGNERVLKTMKRPCNVEDLAAKLIEIRRHRNVFMQSGIIAGFPGESDDEFEDTLRLLKTIEFDNVYVHYYCDMPNTESSAMANKVDKASMLRRLERVKNAGISHNLAATEHEWNRNLAFPIIQN